MKSIRNCFALLSLYGLLVGCSTIVEGTDQTVTVDSEPRGAECLMTREGAGIGTIRATPETVIVDRGDEDIKISCEKEGYLTTIATLPSELEGMTFGNLLFGGLIGVAVDAASDANSKYPEAISIQMVPETFESREERDAFFDARIKSATETLEAAKEELGHRCENARRPTELCENDEEELDKAFDKEFQDIERMRGEAKIAGVES